MEKKKRRDVREGAGLWRTGQEREWVKGRRKGRRGRECGKKKKGTGTGREVWGGNTC